MRQCLHRWCRGGDQQQGANGCADGRCVQVMKSSRLEEIRLTVLNSLVETFPVGGYTQPLVVQGTRTCSSRKPAARTRALRTQRVALCMCCVHCSPNL